MLQEPYELDHIRRQIVLDSIRQHCTYRAWTLLAVHVRSNHAHIVIDAPEPPEKVLIELKSYASRALNLAGLDSPDHRRWTRHGSTRYLWKPDQIKAAIAYVVDSQGDPMATYVNEVRW